MSIKSWVFVGSAVAAVVAVGAVATIAGPALLAVTSPVEKRHYDSWAAAPSRDQDAAAAQPDWAPADARDIEMEYRVRNVPGYTLAMTSVSGVDLAACHRLSNAHGGPAMESTLLPGSLPDRPWTCGDGRAVWQDGDRIWSWATNSAIGTD